MDNILIVNHDKSQCGIYQYGIDIFNALRKSKQYHFDYIECDNPFLLHESVKEKNINLIIYNYYPTTMPWVNQSVTKQYKMPQLSIFHEVTQSEADVLDNSVFDGYLCPDPTLKKNKFVYPTNRLIPNYTNSYEYPSEIVIGSFGFGIGDKGFDRIIKIAKEEFGKVKIRIHMPFNTIIDVDGESHALNTAKRCREVAMNSDVELEINHTYMDKGQLLDFLAGNTINAFFYNSDKDRGISSTIDSALAVRRPIAITKCGMFRHVLGTDPSICIEDFSFSKIIDNGIKPLCHFYEEWSEENFIKSYENIVIKMLGR